MKDVAEHAGVGVGTVSRVMTNRGSVSADTRRRVEQSARQLNYRPSGLGRGLRRQRTDNIGLVVADISNNFYGEFAEAVLRTARSIGRRVIVYSSDEDPALERDYIDMLIEERVEGVIAFPAGGNVEAWQSALDHGINVVFADRTVDELAVPSVLVDHEAGSRTLTEYLLALGHARIGYLGGPRSLTSGQLREDGFRDAYRRAGMDLDEELVVRGRFTRDTAYASAMRLLQVSDAPTALIASNNVLGEAALAALRDNGLRVPDDVSIVMFDDPPWANIVIPAITVLSQPVRTMGQMAARLVAAPLGTDSAVPHVLAGELLLRDSARAIGSSAAAERRT